MSSEATEDLLHDCNTNAHLLLLPFLPGTALQDKKFKLHNSKRQKGSKNTTKMQFKEAKR